MGTWTCLCVVLLWTVGCTALNRDGLTKEVLEADPAFAAVLEKRRELANYVETFQRELALKRSTVEGEIAQLRKDLATATEAVQRKITDTKNRMAPDRQRLELPLAMASEEVRTTQLQRASLGRSMARLKKGLAAAHADSTQDERARQEAQLEELKRDAARLDHELRTLKAHIRLLKVKLLLIQW